MEKILVLDFGDRKSRLIAQRVRECKVYSEVLPHTTPFEEIERAGYSGIIISDSQNGIHSPCAPHCDKRIFSLGIPILGICYGGRLMTDLLGGRISDGTEDCKTVTVKLDNSCMLLQGLKNKEIFNTEHGEQIVQVPTGFRITAKSEGCPIAAMEDVSRRFFALCFHPETAEPPVREKLFKNFLYNCCGCHAEWTPSAIIRRKVAFFKQEFGDRRVLCALSGGVASSVSAALLKKALGDRLTCIFIDHGMLRLGEAESVLSTFGGDAESKLISVKAQERFIGKLIGISDSSAKQSVVKEELLRILEEEGIKHSFDVLAVGKNLSSNDSLLCFEKEYLGSAFHVILEPLSDLYRSEIFALAVELGLSVSPFFTRRLPVFGLADRISGNITEEKISVLQTADRLLCDELSQTEANGFFTVLCEAQADCNTDLDKKQKYTVVLKPYKADSTLQIPCSDLFGFSSHMAATVPRVRNVFFDITHYHTEDFQEKSI